MGRSRKLTVRRKVQIICRNLTVQRTKKNKKRKFGQKKSLGKKKLK